MANLEEAEARLAEMRQDVAQDKEKDVNLSRMVNMMASWIDGKRRRAQSVSTSSR